METLKKVQELKKKEESYSHLFILEMQKISREASQGDSKSLEILNQMLGECGTPSAWRERNRYCSMVIHALVRTRTPESLKSILRYIQTLTDTTPFGAIELISSLLPLYSKIILGPAREMAQNKNREVVRAIGIQTLCNMYLENYLSREEANHLAEILHRFKSDRYFSQHHADLVRSAMTRHKIQEQWDFSSLPISNESDIPAETEQSESDLLIQEIMDDMKF